MKKKPIIGLTLDIEKPGDYSKFDWYAIRKNYIDSIEKLGGIAFPLPHNLNNIRSLVLYILHRLGELTKCLHLQY